MKNIVLIGIPGSGKTSMGRVLAETIGREFIDLDDLIVEREGQSISDIFEYGGEPLFRLAETEAIKAIAHKEGGVIACGGGVVLKEENMKCLSEKGIIVFLDRPAKDIINSLNLKNRPLLAGNPEALYKIKNERQALYEKYSDFTVKCEKGKEDILRELVKISKLGESTLRLAVIGDPISHSLSPYIHMAALEPFFKEVRYEKERVSSHDLSSWINIEGNLIYDGFNVTMPHKENIIPLLDRVENQAKITGSVNTVVNKNKELIGYSTDGPGFSQALNSIGENFKVAGVTFIGSGGATATLAARAAGEGAGSIHIVARNLEKARDIINKIWENYGIKCYAYEFSSAFMEKRPWDSHIIINTTPLGMGGVEGNFVDFKFLDCANKDGLVCDLIYNPARTKLLEEAGKRNLKIMGGLDMLIYQAIYADSLYTGIEMGIKRAESRIKEKLKSKVEGI